MECFEPTWMEVSLDAIRANSREIHQLGGPFCAVLKANGYGRGAIALARSLDQSSTIRCFAVSTLTEAKELRQHYVRKPVLLLTPVLQPQLSPQLDASITYCIGDHNHLDQLEQCAKARGIKPKVHIKIDIGMNRLGTPPDNGRSLVAVALASQWLQLEGIFTHFPNAFSDHRTTKKQLEEFLHFRRQLGRQGERLLWHSANSAAFLQFPESRLSMARLGTLLYGHSPIRHELQLEPTCSLYSRFVQVKPVAKGDYVGYGRDGKMSSDTLVGIVPVGYHDGPAVQYLSGRPLRQMTRLLRNALHPTHAIVQDQTYPIVGRISMGMCCVDLGRHPNPKRLVGSKVELPVQPVAVGQHIPRIYTLNGKKKLACRLNQFYKPAEKKQLWVQATPTELSFLLRNENPKEDNAWDPPFDR